MEVSDADQKRLDQKANNIYLLLMLFVIESGVVHRISLYTITQVHRAQTTSRLKRIVD